MVKYLADIGAQSSKEKRSLPSIMMGVYGSENGSRNWEHREDGTVYVCYVWFLTFRPSRTPR